MVGGFLENFDAPTTPALPVNWAFVRTGGTNAATAWKTNVGTRYPSGNPAVSSPNVADFNSFIVTDGNAARLYYTQPFDMTAIPLDEISFQMLHSSGLDISHMDTLQVVVSTDGGATWIGVGTPIDRTVATTIAWQSHTVNLGSLFLRHNGSEGIGFLAVSAYGDDIHIDNVSLGAPATCGTKSGGLLMGNVFDGNTLVALNGAMVEPAGAAPIIAGPAGPVLGDGFYYGFIPAGSPTAVQASMAGGYGVNSTSLTVANNSALWHDFYLPAGVLTATPTSFAQTLTMDTTGTQTLTLGNIGTLPLNYSVMEINLPPTLWQWSQTRIRSSAIWDRKTSINIAWKGSPMPCSPIVLRRCSKMRLPERSSPASPVV